MLIDGDGIFEPGSKRREAVHPGQRWPRNPCWLDVVFLLLLLSQVSLICGEQYRSAIATSNGKHLRFIVFGCSDISLYIERCRVQARMTEAIDGSKASLFFAATGASRLG